MSLRTTFLLLLLANLAFLGWAALIDVPPEPPQSDVIGNLPRLKLLSEVHGKVASPDPAGTSASSASSVSSASTPGTPAAAGSNPSGANASAANGSAANGAARPAASAQSPPTAAVTAGAVPAGTSRRCVTIGPFADPERARKAADVLQGRGYMPHGRTASSRTPQGYWVFVGGLKSPADEASVLQRLERNGISDAKAMPTSNGARRVSVGLFNALDGAERRARAVRSLGLDAQVEPRRTEEAHWVDVDLDSSTQSLPAEDLLSLEEPGSRLEIKECPAPEQGARSGTPDSSSLFSGAAATPGAPARAAPQGPARTEAAPARRASAGAG